MRDLGGFQLWEQHLELVFEVRENLVVTVESIRNRGPKVVRGPSAAEDDAAVLGALPVDQKVATVAERRALGEASTESGRGSVATTSE